jgi:hypothetical protein
VIAEGRRDREEIVRLVGHILQSLEVRDATGSLEDESKGVADLLDP